MLIDGKYAVLGRLASFVAKELLKGSEIAIVNSEKIIITGNPKSTLQKYIARRQRGSAHHGPFFPKKPDMIVRRAVRGMLPYKTPKGRAALKKLRVYINTPKEFENAKTESFGRKEIKTNFITIRELSKLLGWSP